MTDAELQTLRAAVRVKLRLSIDAEGTRALARGMPSHRVTELGLNEAAEFVLRRFVTDQGETEILRRLPSVAPTKDVDRE